MLGAELCQVTEFTLFPVEPRAPVLLRSLSVHPLMIVCITQAEPVTLSCRDSHNLTGLVWQNYVLKCICAFMYPSVSHVISLQKLFKMFLDMILFENQT